MERTSKFIIEHSDHVNAVVFSPDGKYFISGSGKEPVSHSGENTIKVWDTTTGELIHTLKGHGDCVTSLSVSPNGKYIISGSEDSTIRVWELGSGKHVRTLKKHKDEG